MILGQLGLTDSIDYSHYNSIDSKDAILAIKKENKTVLLEDSEQGIFFATMGRIDNCEELSVHLGSQPHSAAYIFEAFKKWGESCPSRLLGDWVFVAIDTLKKEVFVARDQNGFNSMFFTYDAHGILFSTSLQPLLKLQKEFNPKYALGMLALWKYNSLEETIFKGIFRVPRGHTLRYKNGQIKTERYWFPERTPLRIYKNRAEYAEEFLEITKKAIECRIGDKNKVCSMLSGGLDSGTVSVLAAEILGNSPLTTFSHVPLYKNSSPLYQNWFDDESDYIDATAMSRPNINSIKLQSEHISPLQGIAKFIDRYNTIIHASANAFWLIDLLEVATQHGFEVMLSGQFGNAALSYTGLHSALPLGRVGPYNYFKNRITKPILKKHLEFKQFNKSLNIGYINAEAIEDFGIKQDVLENRTGRTYLHRTKNEEIISLINKTNRHQIIDSLYENTCEKRDPTADIRIIEYAMSIPNEHFFNQRLENKQIIRNMMAGRLPDKVLLETRSGLQASDIAKRLYAEKDLLVSYFYQFQQNTIFWYMVDCKKLENHIQLFVNQKFQDNININQILKTIMLGMFLEKYDFR